MCCTIHVYSHSLTLLCQVVQHRLVELEWPGGAPTSKIQELCREKRYNALSKICQERGIDVLMTGHHLNDQIGQFKYAERNYFYCYTMLISFLQKHFCIEWLVLVVL